MLITGQCNESTTIINNGRTLNVPYDAERVREGVRRWNNGELIQNALSFMTPDEREFLMTGILPEEWDAMFGEED